MGPLWLSTPAGTAALSKGVLVSEDRESVTRLIPISAASTVSRTDNMGSTGQASSTPPDTEQEEVSVTSHPQRETITLGTFGLPTVVIGTNLPELTATADKQHTQTGHTVDQTGELSTTKV